MEIPTIANNRDVYFDRIAPLIDQIHALCTAHSIPFLAVFEVESRQTVLSAKLLNGCMALLGQALVLFDSEAAGEFQVVGPLTASSSAKA